MLYFALMCQARGDSCYGNLTDAAAFFFCPCLPPSLSAFPHSTVLATDVCVRTGTGEGVDQHPEPARVRVSLEVRPNLQTYALFCGIL